MKRLLVWRLGICLGFCVNSARAQGLLVVTDSEQSVALPRPGLVGQPVPPSAYKIRELAVQARLMDQVAQVQVSQTFVNTGSTQLEVSFMFPLPYDGAIDRLTLMVDGKEIPAKLQLRSAICFAIPFHLLNQQRSNY